MNQRTMRCWVWRIRHAIAILRCRRRVVFVMSGLGMVVAVIVNSTMTPTYTSRVRVYLNVSCTDCCL